MAETAFGNLLNQKKWFPKLSSLFTVKFIGENNFEFPEWTIREFGRPGVSFDEIELQYLNTRRYYPSPKEKRETIDMVIEDPQVPSNNAVTEIWKKFIFDQSTGVGGTPAMYMQQMYLTLYDPSHNPKEQWKFLDCFMTKIDRGKLSWYDDPPKPLTIALTIRYNEYQLIF